MSILGGELIRVRLADQGIDAFEDSSRRVTHRRESQSGEYITQSMATYTQFNRYHLQYFLSHSTGPQASDVKTVEAHKMQLLIQSSCMVDSYTCRKVKSLDSFRVELAREARRYHSEVRGRSFQAL